MYKANHVKSRVEYWLNQPSKAKKINYYDQLGKITDFILTDNDSGTQEQMHITYRYNKDGKMSGYINNMFTDSLTEEAIYQYNSQGKLIKILHTIGGQRSEVDNITYHPCVETSIYYDEKGNVVGKDTAYYITDNVYTRYSGFEFREGKKETWHYTLKPVFDAQGKLISLGSPENQNPDTFCYNEKGLLIKRLSGSPQRRLVTIFEYTYYLGNTSSRSNIVFY